MTRGDSSDARRRAAAVLALVLLSLWVLAAAVAVDFPRRRIKLVTSPRAAATSVTLPLRGAEQIPGRQLVFVYRIRNTGTVPVSITARMGDAILRETTVRGGGSARVDLSWPRHAAGQGAIELTATSPWTLEYAEVANLHGFTRGAIELVVLPAAQSFGGPPWWAASLLVVCALTAARLRPDAWPWGAARAAHAALAAAIAVLFLAVVLSPWLSPYRLVLSLRTFLLAVALILLPQVLHVMAATGRWAYAAAGRVAPAMTRPLTVAVLLAAAVGYAVLLWLHMGAYASGADASGYLNSARLLAARRAVTPMRRVPPLSDAGVPVAAYVPLGFRPHGPDQMAPTYPMGLPLLVAASAPLFGWTRAPGVVMLLHAVAGVVLTGLLGRACGLPPALALMGAVALATSPLYLFMSVQLMSDIPALVWTTTAVVLCAGGARSNRGRWTDLLAGCALSLAVLVRPTNVLAVLPLAICLGRAWRRWLLLAAGGLPGAVLLFVYNAAAYGAAVTTGYGDTSSAFAVRNVFPSVRNYVTWLPVLLTPFGLLALGLPALAWRGARMASVLLVWALSLVVFYAFYFHTHEWWWYLRFLLPAFPPLIVGALWVAAVAWRRWCSGSRGMRAAPVVGAIAVAVLAHNTFWSGRLDSLAIGRGERVYVDTTSWAVANLPADAAVLTVQASGSFLYYTAFPIIRWDRCDRGALERIEARMLDAGTPLYAVFFPFEIDEQHAFDRIPGLWARVGRVRDVTAWRLVATDGEVAGRVMAH